jgi:hypothetical protein
MSRKKKNVVFDNASDSDTKSETMQNDIIPKSKTTITQKKLYEGIINFAYVGPSFFRLTNGTVIYGKYDEVIKYYSNLTKYVLCDIIF